MEALAIVFLALICPSVPSALPRPAPFPQIIVRSQHLLFGPHQHGRQIDLTHALPNNEVFWLNLEEGYFACQRNQSSKFLKLFKLSRLCDGVPDCFAGSDEQARVLKCSEDCSPPCQNGRCLAALRFSAASSGEAGEMTSRCHCHDGFGGKSCSQRDRNECRLRPCSPFASCTNTLGSFTCTCRAGFEGDGFVCKRRPDADFFVGGSGEAGDIRLDDDANGIPHDADDVEKVISSIKDIVGGAEVVGVEGEDADNQKGTEEEEESQPVFVVTPSPPTVTTSQTSLEPHNSQDGEEEEEEKSEGGLVGAADQDSSEDGNGEQNANGVVDRIKNLLDLLGADGTSSEEGSNQSNEILDAVGSFSSSGSSEQDWPDPLMGGVTSSGGSDLGESQEVLPPAKKEGGKEEPVNLLDFILGLDDSTESSEENSGEETLSSNGNASIANKPKEKPSLINNRPAKVAVDGNSSSNGGYSESEKDQSQTPVNVIKIDQSKDEIDGDENTPVTLSNTKNQTPEGGSADNKIVWIIQTPPPTSQQDSDGETSAGEHFDEHFDNDELEESGQKDPPKTTSIQEETIEEEEFEDEVDKLIGALFPDGDSGLDDQFGSGSDGGQKGQGSVPIQGSKQGSGGKPVKDANVPKKNIDSTFEGDSKITFPESTDSSSPSSPSFGRPETGVLSDDAIIFPQESQGENGDSDPSGNPSSVNDVTNLEDTNNYFTPPSTTARSTSSPPWSEGSGFTSSFSTPTPPTKASPRDFASSPTLPEKVTWKAETSTTRPSYPKAEQTSSSAPSTSPYPSAEALPESTTSNSGGPSLAATSSSESNQQSPSPNKTNATFVPPPKSATVVTEKSTRRTTTTATTTTATANTTKSTATAASTTTSSVFSVPTSTTAQTTPRTTTTTTTARINQTSTKSITTSSTTTRTTTTESTTTTTIVTAPGTLTPTVTVTTASNIATSTSSTFDDYTSSISQATRSPTRIPLEVGVDTKVPSSAKEPSVDQITTLTEDSKEPTATTAAVTTSTTSAVASGPPSYSANEYVNTVQDILEPCSSQYFTCSGADPCLDAFGRCSVDRLSDPGVSGGVIPTELAAEVVESREDPQLPRTLLECILTHQNCIVPNDEGCMADFQSCSIAALEDSRRRRLLAATSSVFGRENVQGPEVDSAAKKEAEDRMSELLSRNFTVCVSLYTDCVDFYSSSSLGASDQECAQTFDQCSLALLFEFNFNSTSDLSALDESALDSLDGEGAADRRLATELYECIRDHMMCLMGAGRNVCMGDYQACSLAAMDRARRTKNKENKNSVVARHPPRSDDDPPPFVPPPTPREDPSSHVEPSLSRPPPPGVVPGIVASVPRHREDEGGLQHPRDAAAKPIGLDVDEYVVVEPRENVASECEAMGVPIKFGSFSGRPARNIADCSWDFFSCTRNSGVWPANKPCCQARFDNCCMHVMGTKKKPMKATQRPPINQIRPTRPPLDENGNRVELIDCIWGYMGCTERSGKSERECKEEFNACSMIAMGMGPPQTTTRRPINDIDIPEDLPDFLRPTEAPARPILDIDLPQEQEQLLGQGPDLALDHPEGQESNEFLSCLLRLFRCQELGFGASDCPRVDRCRPTPPDPPAPDKETQAVDAELTGGSKPECRWSYFACGRSNSQAECRRRFRECSGGRNPDNEICAETAQNPQNYLLPHPEDCTKFYSCQNLGGGRGWVAHLMSCPESTGFDLELRICNFLRSLPRCRRAEYRLYRAYQDINGMSARLTRSASFSLTEPREVTFAFLRSSDRADQPSAAADEARPGLAVLALAVAAVGRML